MAKHRNGVKAEESLATESKDRLEKLSAKLEQVAGNAARQRGPDPNRVYPVKIDGSPVEGPLTAAVTIAEFSDFQ